MFKNADVAYFHVVSSVPVLLIAIAINYWYSFRSKLVEGGNKCALHLLVVNEIMVLVTTFQTKLPVSKSEKTLQILKSEIIVWITLCNVFMLGELCLISQI
jgi:hypothetical protein